MEKELIQLVKTQMSSGNRLVPARLQSALALLEKLRTAPSLDLADHLVKRGRAALSSHESFGDLAHERFGLKPINSTHGRRSSNIQDWGQTLLDLLRAQGYEAQSDTDRSALLDAVQRHFVERLRSILEQDPITVHFRGRTVEAVVRDVLQQAGEKGKSGDVAQYLVGAKLELRLNIHLPVHPANKSDRKSISDPDAKLGDHIYANSIIEIALGLPDQKHLTQIEKALDASDSEFWLLTGEDRVDTWNRELGKQCESESRRRVVVTSVESFVGQNITELGGFSTSGKADQLRKLFEIYNERWIAQVGSPGIRVVLK